MTLDTPKEIELKARIDEIDCALFLLNSGVSDSAVRTGFLERRREWVKQLNGGTALSKEASERLLSDILEDESREEKLREALEEIAYGKQHTGVIPCPQDYEFYIRPWRDRARAALTNDPPPLVDKPQDGQQND
jgi:hypothetical protein